MASLLLTGEGLDLGCLGAMFWVKTRLKRFIKTILGRTVYYLFYNVREEWEV